MFDNVVFWLDKGGIALHAIVLLSIFAMALTFFKWLQFVSIKKLKRRDLEEAFDLLNNNKQKDAVYLLEESDSTFGTIAANLISNLGSNNNNVDNAVAESNRAGNRFLDDLRSNLRGLEVTAQLSPLLGLLGTVVGMIEAFIQLEGAGSQIDPTLLAGGIWEALLTTAAGLSVAIPTIIILNYFDGRVERLRQDLSDITTRILLAIT